MSDPIIPREFRSVTRPSLTKSLMMVPVAAVALVAVTLPFSCTTVTDYEVSVLKKPDNRESGERIVWTGALLCSTRVLLEAVLGL